MSENKHGGQRKNAGRKKSPYQTKTIAFRVRLEIIDEVKQLVKEFISSKKQIKPKKPYRIKTRQEMIDGGDKDYPDGFIYPTAEAIPWNPEMNYLHGLELDTNNEQTINSEPNHALGEWTIAPWMITENN